MERKAELLLHKVDLLPMKILTPTTTEANPEIRLLYFSPIPRAIEEK